MVIRQVIVKSNVQFGCLLEQDIALFLVNNYIVKLALPWQHHHHILSNLYYFRFSLAMWIA